MGRGATAPPRPPVGIQIPRGDEGHCAGPRGPRHLPSDATAALGPARRPRRLRCQQWPSTPEN
eukprot:5712596-Alexandrium_andersonii.AAC.1